VLKNAIKNLLSQLSSAAAANGDLNVSIIPFLRVDVWIVPLLNRLHHSIDAAAFMALHF
jgi:hypothetical protein